MTLGVYQKILQYLGLKIDTVTKTNNAIRYHCDFCVGNEKGII